MLLLLVCLLRLLLLLLVCGCGCLRWLLLLCCLWCTEEAFDASRRCWLGFLRWRTAG
jgi:hypothetical protein